MSPHYREVRRGPEDEVLDTLAGDGWILPRAEAQRLGLLDARKCRACGYVEGSEGDNPVTALLGPKPCKGREWLGHDWGQE